MGKNWKCVPTYAVLSSEDLKKISLNFKQENKLPSLWAVFNADLANFVRIMIKNNAINSLWKLSNLEI